MHCLPICGDWLYATVPVHGLLPPRAHHRQGGGGRATSSSHSFRRLSRRAGAAGGGTAPAEPTWLEPAVQVVLTRGSRFAGKPADSPRASVCPPGLGGWANSGFIYMQNGIKSELFHMHYLMNILQMIVLYCAIMYTLLASSDSSTNPCDQAAGQLRGVPNGQPKKSGRSS